MTDAAPAYPTLDAWIAAEAIPFSLDAAESLNAAVDKIVASLGESVEVLGLGEPTHMVEAFLTFRNRVFERLVERHGYTAIAIESSFPRGRLVDDFVSGNDSTSFDEVMQHGVTHDFARLQANRELVQWMRRYNAEHTDRPLRFDGFDGPMEMMYTDSPRVLMHFVLDYLAPIDGPAGSERRQRIDSLLGDDAPWENQEAAFDPSKSIGLSPAAKSLGIEAQKLSAEMRKRRDELVAVTGEARYEESLHYLRSARQLLTYHAIAATPSDTRVSDMLGQRDVMQADNLVFIAKREQTRGGKVFAFAHNGHLKLGQMEWQMGDQHWKWWPAGSHVRGILGPRYAVMGMGVAASEAMKLAAPEPGTLEALLTTAGSSLVIPTHLGQGLPTAEIAALPTRTNPNPGYFPFAARSLTDFDALAVLAS